MINFREMELPEDILCVLYEFEIDFAFQPIYRLKDMCLIGYEALMRPKDKTPLDLIDEYNKKGELHKVELATMFGSLYSYRKRGYDTKLDINSFPEISLTNEEAEIFHSYFPEARKNVVIEILEYTTFNSESWEKKKKHLKDHDIRTALDDFGTGNNTDTSVVDIYEPIMVKLDRNLISGIDTNKELQRKVTEYVETFHKMNVLVLAECVETEAELNYLKSIGIDLAQGYYLGKPA